MSESNSESVVTKYGTIGAVVSAFVVFVLALLAYVLNPAPTQVDTVNQVDTDVQVTVPAEETTAPADGTSGEVVVPASSETVAEETPVVTFEPLVPVL